MTQLGLLTTDGAAPATRGRCHVHFGDWREQEPSWPRPFVYVSDVPYGVDYVADFGMRKGASGDITTLARKIVGDKTTGERDAAMAVPGWTAAAIFGPSPKHLLTTVPPWPGFKEILIWDKGEGAGVGDCSFPWKPTVETVAIYGRGWKGRRTGMTLRGSTLAFGRGSNPHNGRQHPNEKPLSVVCELVSKAPPELPVVDPFTGSGTTAVACALLGREFYGAEIDPAYFDVIRGRLAAVGVVLP